jgi:ribonuclease BN (tRNA processing enzyme)
MRGEEQLAYLTSYLINDTLAIDAGGLGFFRDPFVQARVRHVLISHTHMDHIASLPIFVENAYEGKPDCVTIHGSSAVLESMQRDVFNDRIWPDFIKLSTGSKAPFLKLSPLENHKPVELEGLTITPIPMDHVVPTQGFIVEEDGAAVVIASDTGPTQAIWDAANAHPNVKALFLEACFPNNMKWLAEVSKHLTPEMFGAELRKLNKQVPTYVVHIKARFYAQVVAELMALGMPNVDIGRFERVYEFT